MLLVGTASASELANPSTDGDYRVNQAVNFSVQNKTSLTNMSLQLAAPESGWKSFEMSYEDGGYGVTVPGSYFSSKGIYRYRFTNGSVSFPSGSFRLSISAHNQTFRSRALNLTENVSESQDCPYNTTDSSCGYETFQAEMMLSNLEAYVQTDNQTFLNRSLDYALSSYDDTGGLLGTCNHAENDFSCNDDGNDDELEVSAGLRQGSLVNALWRVYGATNNSAVRALAENYSRGSAEGCDVWSDDFKCNTSTGQGEMIQGYWRAYTVTGNRSYKSIAKNLSATNYSSPSVAEALFDAYKLTGNNYYSDRAKNISKTLLSSYRNESTNVSERTHLRSLLAFWNGYEATENYGYYFHASNLTSYSENYSCNPSNASYRCSFPDTQGLHSRVYWDGLKYRKDEERGFSDPQFGQETVFGINLSLKPQMRGDMRDPEILYRMRGNKNWSSCDINLLDGCTLPASNVSNQTVYSYKFRDGNLSFPENGSFRFSISLGSEELEIEAENFSSANPEQYCQPWSGDFSCEDSFYQAEMIDGFSTAFLHNTIESYREGLVSFIESPFRTQAGSTPACSPEKDDFNCNTSSVVEDLEGSLRQGRLIQTTLESYRSTGNYSLYETSLKFVKGSAEDCDVWRQDFNCGSSEGQAAMIDGYWEAYKVTGNETYKEVALNLSRQAQGKNATERLGSALWRTYSYTNNSSYSEQASNITDSSQTGCGANCGPESYGLGIRLFENAYVYGDNNTYLPEYRSLLGNTTSSGCGPFKGNYSCETPEQQGLMVSGLYTAAYTVPLNYNTSESFEVPETVQADSGFEATCAVTNRLQSANLSDVQLELVLNSGLSTQNSTYSASSRLPYGNSTSNTWSVTAGSGGQQDLSCVITSSSGLRETLSATVTVQEEEESDSGGGGSGGSSGGGIPSGAFDEEPELPENITLNYSYVGNYSWNRTRLEQLGFDLSNKNLSFNATCLAVERRLGYNQSRLKLENTCGETDLLIADQLPSSQGRNIRTAVFEDFNGSRTIEYGFRGHRNWSRPSIVFSRQLEDLQIQHQLEVIGEYGMLDIDLNRESRCVLTRSGRQLYNGTSTSLKFNISLEEGQNMILFDCETASERFTAYREFEAQENDGGILPILGAAVLMLILSGAVYQRDQVISFSKTAVYRWYLHRFEKAVENGDVKRAIEIYKSLASLLGVSTSKRLLDSDIELMRGIRIYLVMDLVQSGIEEDMDLPMEDIEQIVYRYVEGTDSEEVKKLVVEKLEEVVENESK
ncbi:hypothetical protein [Candidatus Nanohalococcus occultus]|uniref:Ig-like domain-containing protein n=1 Tax=Candidatus Nanohalococcus occultus TaxID=2978047 RepID=A0ABY8CHD5_9ARCH|nr:hypothetical protein SVXNc_0301 [Candidatus Nanohaloarchaeota archaeon SVXNc]